MTHQLRATAALRRLQSMTKGKSRPGRRRGAPAVEHRPSGHHPDRRSRRFGCSGAARSPEPPHPPYAPTRPPRRPLQLTVSPPVARRCASGMVKPAPGGQLTPWKHMASSTTSASSTGRCAPPCPLHTPGMPPTDRTPCCADFAERAPASPRANPDVSRRLWHVLREERTHGFCFCVLRARDAEHFACRGSLFVCVRVLVEVSARVRALSSQICELVNKITFDTHLH